MIVVKRGDRPASGLERGVDLEWRSVWGVAMSCGGYFFRNAIRFSAEGKPMTELKCHQRKSNALTSTTMRRGARRGVVEQE